MSHSRPKVVWVSVCRASAAMAMALSTVSGVANSDEACALSESSLRSVATCARDVARVDDVDPRPVAAAAVPETDVPSTLPEELVLLQVELRVAHTDNRSEARAPAPKASVNADAHQSPSSQRRAEVSPVRASSLMQQNATLTAFVAQVSEDALRMWSGDTSVAKTSSSAFTSQAALVMWSPLAVMLIGACGVLSLIAGMWIVSALGHSGGGLKDADKLAEPNPLGQMSARRLYSRTPMPPTSRLLAQTSAVGSSAMLPPLCETLVMPHTEARFVISMKSLQRPGVETIDINGTTGRTLLRALCWQAEDGRRCLGVCSLDSEDSPRVTVSAAISDSANKALELRGKNKVFYGTIEPTSSGCVVKHRDQQVMTIEEGDPSDLRMTAYANDRSPLAAGGRVADDIWRLAVTPGADAVLIMACMLSRLLLRAS